MMKKILVPCTGNSCRSQIVEGYLRHFAGGKAQVHSAGVETNGVNPKPIQVMKEDDIGITFHREQRNFITIFQTRQKLQELKSRLYNNSEK